MGPGDRPPIVNRSVAYEDSMPTLNVRAGLTKDVTLHVRLVGLRQWAVRIWMATTLIRTAAWVLGCSVNVETGLRRADGSRILPSAELE
jgi:hypothetical protein